MFDIGIIGAGPAGYAAAIRASQKGLNVVLFEKNQIGGTCLNRGCIPVKTILNSCRIYSELKNTDKFGVTAENIGFDFAKIWQRQKTVSEKIRKSLTMLIKSYGITIIEEEATVSSEHVISTKTDSHEVKNIIIATGSRPNILKFNGNYSDDFILTSDDILNLTQLPSSVLIVGSGAIGIEWARILSSLNVKVCIVEIMEKLIPFSDYEVSERVARLLRKNKIDFYTSTSIEEIQGKEVKLSNGKTLDVDFILLGAGRTAEICSGSIINDLNTKKYIDVDYNFKTTINNIFAIGDVNGRSLLAHSAIKQAEEVINYIISGENEKFDKNLVPSVIFGTPEIASIGLTEQELIEKNTNYKKSFFPVSALGKAYADDKIDGFIKILATEDKILGAHIISEEASALIQQIAIAMTNNIKPKELQNVIFAHPTYSEGILESILALDNIAINLPKKTETKV